MNSEGETDETGAIEAVVAELGQRGYLVDAKWADLIASALAQGKQPDEIIAALTRRMPKDQGALKSSGVAATWSAEEKTDRILAWLEEHEWPKLDAYFSSLFAPEQARIFDVAPNYGDYLEFAGLTRLDIGDGLLIGDPHADDGRIGDEFEEAYGGWVQLD